jgi:hypothetical protein
MIAGWLRLAAGATLQENTGKNAGKNAGKKTGKKTGRTTS